MPIAQEKERYEKRLRFQALVIEGWKSQFAREESALVGILEEFLRNPTAYFEHAVLEGTTADGVKVWRVGEVVLPHQLKDYWANAKSIDALRASPQRLEKRLRYVCPVTWQLIMQEKNRRERVAIAAGRKEDQQEAETEIEMQTRQLLDDQWEKTTASKYRMFHVPVSRPEDNAFHLWPREDQEPAYLQQGQLEDCWLLAAINSLSDPQMLPLAKHLIEEVEGEVSPVSLAAAEALQLREATGDEHEESKAMPTPPPVQVFKVKFFGDLDDATASKPDREVQVAATFPAQHGVDDTSEFDPDKLFAAHYHPNRREVWGMLLEKAVAQLYGSEKSYEALGPANPRLAFELLTGGIVERLALDDVTLEDSTLWDALRRGRKQNALMGCISKTQFSSNGFQVKGDGRTRVVNGIVLSHAYTIKDIAEVNLPGLVRRKLWLVKVRPHPHSFSFAAH